MVLTSACKINKAPAFSRSNDTKTTHLLAQTNKRKKLVRDGIG
jgi:hypothetical protein